MAFLQIIDSALNAFVIGSLLTGLRLQVGRQKELLVEGVSFAGLLGLAWLWNFLRAEPNTFLSGSNDASFAEFAISYPRLSYGPLYLLLLTTASLLIWDISSRAIRFSRLQLADLFHLTLAVVLGLYVYLNLDITVFIAAVALVAIFLLGFLAHHHAFFSRATSLCFVFGYFAAIGSTIFCHNLPTQFFFPSQQNMGFGSGLGLQLLTLTAALQWPARFWSRCMLFLPGWPRFARQVAATSLAIDQPNSHIRKRNALALWRFAAQTTYLNHGSFGAVPITLRQQQARLRRWCEDQPMRFLARQYEARWLRERAELAARLGAEEYSVAFCENATAAMNEIAAWFPLEKDDEVLLNNHEYGAVRRIWTRACASAGARLVEVELPIEQQSLEEIENAIMASCNTKTRLVVLSHITSPTAIRLPIESLCQRIRQHGAAICIDGPHAILQEPLHLTRLGCDFYTASCHKWLSAPIGSGFVYVAPHWHARVNASRLSWGRLPPHTPENWSDELVWTGTRDGTANLLVNSAFRFFEALDLRRVDERNYALACYARRQLASIPGAQPVTPEGRKWFGWLVAIWLPHEHAEDYAGLQQRLAQRYGIEVPIVQFQDRYLVRVSCHLYNSTHDVDYLCHALRQEIGRA